MQASLDSHSHDDVDRQANPLSALATLLLAPDEPAAFNPSSAGVLPLRNPSIVPRAASPVQLDAPWLDGVDPKSFALRTVGDVKNAFYKSYGMPIGSFEANSFVSQIITSQSVAMVSSDFAYSRIYAFGLESLCAFFLDTLKDDERAKIKSCMLTAMGFDPAKIKADAEAMETLAKGGEDALLSSEDFKLVAGKEHFKYTYPFGAGLLALMPLVDKEQSEDTIEKWTSKLNIEASKLKKDQTMYDMAVAKLAEVKEMMLQMQIGAKKKEAEKLQKQAEAAEKEAAAASTPAEAPKKEADPPAEGGRSGVI